MKLANFSLGGECLGHGGSVASNVRFWHKADMPMRLANVRFWGNSGHCDEVMFKRDEARRIFSSTAVAWPLTARAQQPATMLTQWLTAAANRCKKGGFSHVNLPVQRNAPT